jgi:hypothetical protein
VGVVDTANVTVPATLAVSATVSSYTVSVSAEWTDMVVTLPLHAFTLSKRLVYEGDEVRLDAYEGGLPLCTELRSSEPRFRDRYLRMLVIDKDQGWAPVAVAHGARTPGPNNKC